MWEHFVDYGKPQITRRMRIAFWLPKATNTHSEYVILSAFPLQQWLQEHTSILRHMHILCPVSHPYE